jgi:CBS domain-containing protein
MSMKAKDVMRTTVITLHQSATYEDAGRLLYTRKISGVPVVDDDNKLVGMISEKDLFRVLYPFTGSFHEHPEQYLDHERREDKIEEIKKNRIERFMSRDIIVISPEDPIMKVGAIMLARGIHRLPVMEGDKIVGIISRRDIFKNVLKKHLQL